MLRASVILYQAAFEHDLHILSFVWLHLLHNIYIIYDGFDSETTLNMFVSPSPINLLYFSLCFSTDWENISAIIAPSIDPDEPTSWFIVSIHVALSSGATACCSSLSSPRFDMTYRLYSMYQPPVPSLWHSLSLWPLPTVDERPRVIQVPSDDKSMSRRMVSSVLVASSYSNLPASGIDCSWISTAAFFIVLLLMLVVYFVVRIHHSMTPQNLTRSTQSQPIVLIANTEQWLTEVTAKFPMLIICLELEMWKKYLVSAMPVSVTQLTVLVLLQWKLKH